MESGRGAGDRVGEVEVLDRVDDLARELRRLRRSRERIEEREARHRQMRFRGAYGGAELPAVEIGRAHVCTPVSNAHLVCRNLLDKKTTLLRVFIASSILCSFL